MNKNVKKWIKVQLTIWAISFAIAIPIVCGAYGYWSMRTFDDPVYVDHFRALGNAEKVTHPEYRAYICAQSAKYSYLPKWAVHNPSYCRQRSQRRRKLRKIRKIFDRGYCEVGSFFALLQLPAYIKLLSWVDRRFPEIELRETHFEEYLRWGMNEIKKSREFVRSGGLLCEYPYDYDALCQSCDLPPEMAEIMKETGQKIASWAA